MNYFDPKDLIQLQGTYNYTAMSGVGFGVTEANERIFLNARTVDNLKLNVGDVIRVWAVDNYSNPDTSHFPSRWRAVRAEVITRLEDSVANLPHVNDIPTPQPVPQPVPHPMATLEKFIATSNETFEDAILRMLDENRPLTVRAIADELIANTPAYAMDDKFGQRVTNKLISISHRGDAAVLKIYSTDSSKTASAVYYAKNTQVFYEHLDTPISADA